MKYLIVLIALSLTSCGSTPAQTVAPFTGTFKGTETGTQAGTAFSQTVIVILTQVGPTVSGTFDTGLGNVGSVSGTASGNSLSSLTITETGDCAGSAAGSNVTLSGNNLSGNLTGSFGKCGTLTAAVSLIKQ